MVGGFGGVYIKWGCASRGDLRYLDHHSQAISHLFFLLFYPALLFPSCFGQAMLLITARTYPLIALFNRKKKTEQMREPDRSQESKKGLRAGIIDCSVGNHPARGQGRLVPGNAAPILALKFRHGRKSLPGPISG